MLAKINVYDSSSELRENIGIIKDECRGTNQAYVLLSKETEGKRSTVYLVTDDEVKAHIGKVDSFENIPRMLIIPTGEDMYYRGSGRCPTEIENTFNHEMICTSGNGTVEYYTNRNTLKGDKAHDALLKKKMFAGSLDDLLDYLGMPEEPSETGSVQDDSVIDFVK